MQRIVVVLPAPLRPRNPRIRPGVHLQAQATEHDEVAEGLLQPLDHQLARRHGHSLAPLPAQGPVLARTAPERPNRPYRDAFALPCHRPGWSGSTHRRLP